MASVSQRQVLQLSNYLSIIHHTKGRIRVSISPKIRELKEEFEKLSINKAKESLNKIEGIKDFKFIALLGTVTIIYDGGIFSAQMLEDFINGQNTQEVTTFINTLLEKI
ncbi:MAG: hypothetical protein LBQ18_07190 [Campylobacteraceae bacterium]|jgi:hypothetical protein|nr:hypothetical protein [Campylobacteraceae bacterium]